MKIIIYKMADGGVEIINPTPEWFEPDDDGNVRTMEQLAAKDVPAGHEWRIAESTALPASRNWRNAWTDTLPTETVDVNLARAKQAHVELIIGKAFERVPADEFGSRDFALVKAEMQELAIAAAATLQELYNLWPASIDARASARTYQMHGQV
jgi:hypothetical protein